MSFCQLVDSATCTFQLQQQGGRPFLFAYSFPLSGAIVCFPPLLYSTDRRFVLSFFYCIESILSGTRYFDIHLLRLRAKPMRSMFFSPVPYGIARLSMIRPAKTDKKFPGTWSPCCASIVRYSMTLAWISTRLGVHTARHSLEGFDIVMLTLTSTRRPVHGPLPVMGTTSAYSRQ
jgi:hypothetical protein